MPRARRSGRGVPPRASKQRSAQGLAVRTGVESRRLPLPVANRLCRSIPKRGHPSVTRSLTTHLPPRRRAGRHRHLPANYRPQVWRRSGKLSRSRRLPEPRASPGRRARRTRFDRAPAARSVPQRFANRAQECVWFEGGYMPVASATGKGNIYNSPGNMRSRSRRRRAAGKMYTVGWFVWVVWRSGDKKQCLSTPR